MEKLKWAALNKRSLESFIYVEFIDRPPSKIPYLEFGPDSNCYTDKTKIHIGMDHFDASDEEELFWDVYYVLGHELQHIKSTTDRDWKAAITGGIHRTCEAIATKVLKKKVRFIKDSDYKRFMDDLKKNGYHLSMQKLGSFVHFICNSLEDGRIEAIRSKEHRNFFKYMKRFRAKNWDSLTVETFFEDGNPVEENVLDPLQKLQIVLNQILSLSTTGIYQKHFLKEYGDGKLCAEVQECIPHIARAVTSKTCRGCMKEAGELIDKLEPLLIEASKMSDFEIFMEQLAEIAKSAIMSTYSASSKNEEQGDGTPGEALFGTSALVIELDEEEFERMKEEAGDEEVENPSVIFVKKGGNSEDDAEPEKESAASTQSAGEAEDSENDSTQGSSTSESQDPEAETSSESGESSDEDGSPEGEESSDTPMEGKASASPDQASDKNTGSSDTTEEEVEAAVKKAKETEKTPEIEITEEDIEKQRSFADKMKGFKNATPKKPDTSGVDDHYPYDVNFNEETRDYTPDIILPVILESKGASLKSKVEALLRQKRKPDERGMRTGTLDSGRLTSLLFSDTTCFKRRGEEEEPDVAGFLLMDNSGSMGNGQGSNRFYCCNAIAIIEHAFSDLMPLKIAAFDAYGSNHVNHVVIKDFDEKGPCNFTHNFYSQGRCGCGNKDGYSIRVATKQLLERQEEEKVLIIASDGLPSDYPQGYTDGIDDVKSAVAYARKQGIKVIGLHMYQDQDEEEVEFFESMYAPEYLLCQLDDIENELSRVMKQLFK